MRTDLPTPSARSGPVKQQGPTSETFGAHALWQRVAPYGVWLVAALILVQTLPALDSRALWYSDEVRYANVLANLIGQGEWLVLSLNGQVYPDKPPVYFLFLAGIAKISGLDVQQTLMLGSALSGILLAAAMVRFGRAIGLGVEERTAGILAWTACLGVTALLHYARMDLLFVALMLFGHAHLHDFVVNRKPAASALVGFGFLGLAALTKGPLGIALPLAALLVTALWVGEGRRLLARAMVLGAVLMIAIVGTWAVGVIVTEGWVFLRDRIIGQQIVARAVDTFHHKEPFGFYFWILPIFFLPWTGFVLAIPARAMLATPLASIRQRRSRRAPADILVLSAVSNFALLSVLDGKVAVYILPVICYLSLLVGSTQLHHQAAAGRFASALLLAALALALVVFVPPAIRAGATPAVGMAATLLLAGAAALVFVRHGGPRLLLVAAMASALGLTVAAGLLHHFDAQFSTRDLARHLAREAAAGATPIAYRTYGGVFSFYAGRDIAEYDNDADLRRAVAAPGPAVIVLPAAIRDDLEPDEFETVARGTVSLGQGEYLIVKEH